MLRILSRLWNDDVGALLATEYVLLAGILVFGSVPGLIALRDANNAAMARQAAVITDLGTPPAIPAQRPLTPTAPLTGQPRYTRVEQITYVDQSP